MTFRQARGAAVVAALTTMVASHVTGEDATTAHRAAVEFRMVATAEGAGTHSAGSFISQPLEEGASTAASMQVTLLPASEGLPCRSNVSMSPGLSAVAHGKFPFWQVDAVVRRVEMDRIALSYTWKRRSSSAGALVEGNGEATVSEDGRVLLDYVPVWETSSGCYRNLALEMSASIPEDAAFKDRRIGYDLWLVREGAGGRQTRRLQLMGKHGERVEFDYGLFGSKLRRALRERPAPAGGTVEMMVAGSVRSRIQADGSIDLLLVARRTARPSDGGWATEAHGEKRVHATAGETLRLELPPPAHFEGANDPETFKAIAEESVALVLTPTLME